MLARFGKMPGLLKAGAGQRWFWSEHWQRMECETGEDVAGGRVRSYEDVDDLLAALTGSREGRSTGRAAPVRSGMLGAKCWHDDDPGARAGTHPAHTKAMTPKQLSAGPPERWCLVFDAGDDVLPTLEGFVRERSIAAASFQALGAFRRATIAWFDLETKEYLDLKIDEQAEVASLVGNVARLADDGSPRLHAHVTLGRRDGTALAGHLRAAEVRPTLELFLTVEETPLERREDDATGLPLLVP